MMKCADANTMLSFVTETLKSRRVMGGIYPLRAAARPRSPRATPRRRATRAAVARNRVRPTSSPWRAERPRGRAPAARRAPHAAVGCSAARPAVSGSRRLHSESALVRLLEFGRRGPHGGRYPRFGDVRLDQAPPEVIPGSLGQHLPPGHPGRGPGAAREEAQPQAQASLVQLGGHDSSQERVELAAAPVLAPRVPEVLPRLEPRRRRLRRGHRRALVQEQLAQRRATPRLPVVVGAAPL